MAWNEPGPGHDPWNQGPGSGGDKPGGGGGPPDLDKLIKRLKASFRRCFGNKKPEPSKMLRLAAIVIAAMWLASGFYMVDAQQKAVVLRFGAVSGESGAGLGWHLPWPIGSVRMVNVTKLRQATTQSTLPTDDHNLVDSGKNGPAIDLHIGEASGAAPPAEASSASSGKVTPSKSSDADGSAADKGGSPDNSSPRSRDHRGTRSR